MIFLVFGNFPAKANGRELTLVYTDRHAKMGKILAERLQPTFYVHSQNLSLWKLAYIVAENKTDIFIVTSTEISRAKRYTKINLSERAYAVGSGDVAEKVHLTTLIETGIKNISDLYSILPDKYLSLGPKNSPTETHALDSIEAHWRAKGPSRFKCTARGGRIKCQNDKFEDQYKKLINHQIKAYYITGEVPVFSVEEVAKTQKLRLANIPKDIVTEMNGVNVLTDYVITEINLNDYRCGPGKVKTAGIPAIVGSTYKVDKVTISEITKILLNNPIIEKNDLPAAIKAVNSIMKLHPYSLEIFNNYGIKLE